MRRTETNEAGHEAHGREALDQLLESAIVRYFYRVLHWLTAWDCDFARATGRNPEHVAYLAERRDEWALLAWKEDYRVVGHNMKVNGAAPEKG